MLYRNTVESRTFDLLVELSQDPKLKHFHLVGGTALSLQLGHRRSIDLDLFTQEPCDAKLLEEHLRKEHFNRRTEIIVQLPNTLMLSMDNIKVDFIQHNYPQLEPLVQSGTLRLANLDDIAAMKVNAIIQSGKRMKDFIDMAEIAHHRTIDEVLNAYARKYPGGMPAKFVRKAISYFDEVITTERPEMIKGKLDWKATQKILSDFVAGKQLKSSS